MLVAGPLWPLVDALGAIGLALALAEIGRRRGFAGAALLALGAGYVVAETAGRAAPDSVVAYAPGLAVLCELLLLASDLPRDAAVERPAIARRLLLLAALALAGALLSLAALAAGAVRLPGGFEAALLGSIAACALLALPLALPLAGVGARPGGESTRRR